MSNVKAGDLAVIVRAPDDGSGNEWIGRFVHVLHRFPYGDELVWAADPTPTGYLAVRDSALRPIRPQSDDARDESWAYLPPVPTTTKKPEHA
jgi:hypothetical protein